MFWPTVRRRSLWREMDRLQREMGRLLDDVSPGAGSTGEFPPVNVWANEEHALITAELPGIAADTLDVSVVDDTVTLSGERPLEVADENVKFHRRERWHGSFSRTLQMPFRIDADAVDASYENGVLQLAVPRAEEDKPRRITVNVNE